jgi:hypothetical protein
MAMRVARWILGLAAAALIAWGAYRAMGWLRAATGCSNVILSEAVTSDGKRTATVFERNCGATTPFGRFVSVRLTKTSFDPEREDQYVFVIDGQPEVRIAWESPDHLSVKFASGRIVRQVLIWYGVTVLYD